MALVKYGQQPLEDLLLLEWWARMAADGDATVVLAPGSERLAVFLAQMQLVDLFYDHDPAKGGVWLAAWLGAGVLGGTTLSLWIAADHRTSLAALHDVLAVLEFAFHKWPVVLVATSQPERDRLFHHFGFVPLGCVPTLYHGDTAYLSYMTMEAWPDVLAKLGGETSLIHMPSQVGFPVSTEGRA